MNCDVNTPLLVQMFPEVNKRPGQDEDWKAILLRTPMNLLKHLDAAAEANYRTRTAEILSRLEASIEGESFDEHGVMVRILRRPGK